jgi:hypothetical protein
MAFISQKLRFEISPQELGLRRQRVLHTLLLGSLNLQRRVPIGKSRMNGCVNGQLIDVIFVELLLKFSIFVLVFGQ